MLSLANEKILFLCLILIYISVKAQEVCIEISTEEPITIYLFEPLDNAYNSRYATDTLYLKPNLKVEYNIPVAGFKYIHIKTSLFTRYVMPIISGDRLSLNFRGKELSISGDNADGLIYYNNHFISEGIADYSKKINQTFDRLIKTLSYLEVNKQCLKEITREIDRDINNMVNSQQISKRFSEIMKTDLNYAFNERIINEYLVLTQKQPQDSLDIKNAINEIFRSYPADIPNIIMYNFASLYVSRYYSRQPYTKNEDFDSYSFYLLSPPEILLPSMGKAFLVDIQYGFKSFDHEKVYSYLASHFPESDYVRILKPMFTKVEKTKQSIFRIQYTILHLRYLF